MRVIVIIKATKRSEAGLMPSQGLLAALGDYKKELVRAGVLLAGDRLRPSSEGKRVLFSGGRKTIVDGPFAETKQLIAGYWIWQVSSMDEALEWARRCPDPMQGEVSEIEIRPTFAAEGSAEEPPPKLLAATGRLEGEG